MLVKRSVNTAANDLTTVYRPYTIDELIGHEANKSIISNGLKANSLSHLMLFTGPSGCGKTTAARIIALGLNCESVKKSTDTPCLECNSCRRIMAQKSLDVMEINVGEDSGKAAVAKLTADLMFAPFECRYKVLIFDEAHKLSTAAQDLLLKKVEDGFKHVYFIFCTNKPEKLEDTFISRASVGKMQFGRMVGPDMAELLINICEYEGASFEVPIIDAIIDAAKGSPRTAIGILKNVMDEGSWELSKVKILLGEFLDETDPNIMEISKCIMSGKFKPAIKVLDKVKNVPEDSIRIAIAGFFCTVLKRSPGGQKSINASHVLDVITVPLPYTGKPSYHVLVNMIYKASLIMSGV